MTVTTTLTHLVSDAEVSEENPEWFNELVTFRAHHEIHQVLLR